MIVCPKCGKVLSYNSYFGAYICDNCQWEDARIGERRNKGGYKVNGSRKVVYKARTESFTKKVLVSD